MAKGYSDDSVVLRILSINFAALHTSTLVLASCIPHVQLSCSPFMIPHPIRV